jgi:predicted dehydrogenase
MIMIRAAVVGLGKMGLSHHAIVNAHPDVTLVAVCDTSRYLLDVVGKYCGVRCYDDHRRMLQECALDAVVIATPSRSHGAAIRDALDHGVHVFVEKPFSLDPAEGRALTARLAEVGRVGQVGYHYRFVASFGEAKRLIDRGAIGAVHAFRIEAYGPVVLRPRGSSWRSRRSEGGGCLYDYASHAVDLANHLFGPATAVSGTVLRSVFSRGVEDEVYATLHHRDGIAGQLAANWSDESHRKMTMRVTAWGTAGKVVADRQECQLYRSHASDEWAAGWTVRYTTDLTPPVWFYLRGEEYSREIDHFVRAIQDPQIPRINTFGDALQADEVIAMLLADAAGTRAGARPAPARRWIEALGLRRSSAAGPQAG